MIVLVIVPGFGIKQSRSVNSSQSSMGSDPAHSTENNSRLRRCFYFAVFTMRCAYVAIFLLGVYYPVDSQPFIPKQDETPGIFTNKLNHELDDPEKFIVFRDLGQRVDEVGR